MAYQTDQELLTRFEYYTLEMEAQIQKGEDFKKVSEHLPFMAIFSYSDPTKIIHTNQRHQKITGYAPDEVREKRSQYLKDIVHPASLEYIRKHIPEFYLKQNHHQTMTFVQQVLLPGNSGYCPVFTFTKPSRLPDGLVIRLLAEPKDFERMSGKMERVLEIVQFKLDNFKRFQVLSNREIEILTLLVNGVDNPKIADQLYISRRTVETHRKHIKRKLDIHSYRDLMKYAFAFDLVQL